MAVRGKKLAERPGYGPSVLLSPCPESTYDVSLERPRSCIFTLCHPISSSITHGHRKSGVSLHKSFTSRLGRGPAGATVLVARLLRLARMREVPSSAPVTVIPIHLLWFRKLRMHERNRPSNKDLRLRPSRLWRVLWRGPSRHRPSAAHLGRVVRPTAYRQMAPSGSALASHETPHVRPQATLVLRRAMEALPVQESGRGSTWTVRGVAASGQRAGVARTWVSLDM